MATSLIGPSVLRAWSAAPEPRPPQPIKASFRVSLPAAWAPRSTDRAPSTPALVTAADVVLRKSRRVRLDGGLDIFGAFMFDLYLYLRAERTVVNASTV